MLVTCWSAKGGTGTTVVAVALATVLAHRPGDGVVLADLAGDVPGVLGVPEPDGPGLAQWLAAGPAVPADALARLEVPVRSGLRLLPRGRGPLLDPDRAEVLASLLAADGRPVVVDAGRLPEEVLDEDHAVRRAVAAAAGRSLLVSRSGWVDVNRAGRLPLRPSGIVLVAERNRALDAHDLEGSLGVPVVAEVPYHETVYRAVDAGQLAARLPSRLERALRWVA